MTDFRALPDGPVTLADVSVPACLVGEPGDLVRRDVAIRDGRIVAGGGTRVDMRGAMLLPAFVDMHTHLDKGHIWPRAPNPDGTFMGALTAVAADRETAWSAEDVRRRADFALRCAYAHGTRAVRTHLDSIPPQHAVTWPIFDELRRDWAGRIDLQGVCLVSVDRVDAEGEFVEIADTVAAHGAVLGMVTYPVPDLVPRLRAFLRLAAERGLSADFHVDETLDPDSTTLRAIAETVLETGFDAPVTVGHCCSLSTQDSAEADRILDLVARAGIAVVSLPMCNLYLQDRQPHRTPRYRGITLVHEMAAHGIPVAFASDNTRDPFYAYGDLDMLEVLRQATRIGHLDHAGHGWARSVTVTPAAICGFEAPSLAPGATADLVVFRARAWTELFSRPQSDRIVLRGGRAIDRTLPDYSELDDLMERA